MNVYIAAPFFTEDQLSIVKRIESALEKECIPYFSPRSEGVLKSMNKEDQKKNKSDIFNSNIRNMDACTHMIACVEYRDTGTSFEIGYAFSSDIPIVLFCEKIDLINVMLAESATAICDNVSFIRSSLEGKYTVEVGDLT
jgi:nucleoside 2-deoxyribosyltransferase